MTENREQSLPSYALDTAATVNALRTSSRLTVREQQLEDQKVLIAMLREKKGVGNDDDTRPPGVFLNKDDRISGTANSTIDKNISKQLEDPSVEGSALKNTLKLLVEDTPPSE